MSFPTSVWEYRPDPGWPEGFGTGPVLLMQLLASAASLELHPPYTTAKPTSQEETTA